ncbi:MAG: hypothetical protein RLZZ436_4160 [Planctomycetota bacterium]|jgi:L-fuconolactonase
MIIDAHHHFWCLDLPFDYGWLRCERHARICRDYLPEDLQPHLREAGVDRTVFVQTQHNPEETRWALRLAESHKFIAGVVGWVDLAASDCEQQLEEFLGNPLFSGVRHIVQDEPDEDFIVRPEVLRGLGVLARRGVPYDLLFYHQHLRHAATVARLFPELPLVIDHLSKPRIREGVMEPWRSQLRAAAAYPNVYCKLSGMVTEADWTGWTAEDLRPYVLTAVEVFGPERCMYGSDWPVCELAAGYERVCGVLRDLLCELSAAETARIFGGTAAEFYRLQLNRECVTFE